jgi:hypothetical protein
VGARDRGYTHANPDERGDEMPVWAWVLLIILVVLLLTGGIGYSRR